MSKAQKYKAIKLRFRRAEVRKTLKRVEERLRLARLNEVHWLQTCGEIVQWIVEDKKMLEQEIGKLNIEIKNAEHGVEN